MWVQKMHAKLKVLMLMCLSATLHAQQDDPPNHSPLPWPGFQQQKILEIPHDVKKLMVEFDGYNSDGATDMTVFAQGQGILSDGIRLKKQEDITVKLNDKPNTEILDRITSLETQVVKLQEENKNLINSITALTQHLENNLATLKQKDDDIIDLVEDFASFIDHNPGDDFATSESIFDEHTTVAPSDLTDLNFEESNINNQTTDNVDEDTLDSTVSPVLKENREFQFNNQPANSSTGLDQVSQSRNSKLLSYVSNVRREAKKNLLEVKKFLFGDYQLASSQESRSKRVWRFDPFWKQHYYIHGGLRKYSLYTALTINATKDENFLIYEKLDDNSKVEYYFTHVLDIDVPEKQAWKYDNSSSKYYFVEQNSSLTDAPMRMYAFNSTASDEYVDEEDSKFHLVYKSGIFYRYADNQEQRSKQEWVQSSNYGSVGRYYFEYEKIVHGRYVNMRVYSKVIANIKSGFNNNNRHYNNRQRYHLTYYDENSDSLYRYADDNEKIKKKFEFTDEFNRKYFFDYDTSAEQLVKVYEEM